MKLRTCCVSVGGIELFLHRHSRGCERHMFAKAIALHLLAFISVTFQDVTLLLVLLLIVVVTFHHNRAHIKLLEIGSLKNRLFSSFHI